jgi:hypothetical protein
MKTRHVVFLNDSSLQAMIFYMKLPDGNLDDLSQHAAMPVIEGEKWFGTYAGVENCFGDILSFAS